MSLQFKTGSGWKACYDVPADRYFAECGGSMEYHLYELGNEQYEKLDAGMSEWDASEIIHDGRHLYMSVNDRCGPPYTVVFDHDYEKLCPWAEVLGSGKVWSDELTDAAVELFVSEEKNRGQRRGKRKEQEKDNDKSQKVLFLGDH
ncbi:MAG: hypothetical protein IJ091_09170 [Oscillospiraceae bacterium]|nr:hypothetical protein [Oscillospiraceae bacterium]